MSSGPPTGGGGGASLSCEEAEATWRDVYVTWDCLNELNMHMYDCVQCTCQHADSHKSSRGVVEGFLSSVLTFLRARTHPKSKVFAVIECGEYELCEF